MNVEHRAESGHTVSNVEPQEASRRLENTLHEALQNGENCIIQAQTGLGKSYTVATTSWLDRPTVTGEQPLIHISQTRKARDEAAEHSRKAGVSYTVVESREELCPVAAGDHDDDLPEIDGRPVSDWIDRKCDVDHVLFTQAHRHLHQELGGLPCSVGKECEAEQRLQNVPRDENGLSRFDVIHATANFLYVPSLVKNTNIIFDEQPEYSTSYSQENLRRVANRLLAENSDGGYRWEGLMEAVRTQDTEVLRDMQVVLNGSFKNRWNVNDENVDTLTDVILRAIAVARPVGEGCVTGIADRVGVVIDRHNTIQRVLQIPDLSTARCVIGLDAHPSPLRWELETGTPLTVRNILSSDESRTWRVRQRQLHVVQVGEDTNSLTRGWRGKAEESAVAIIEAIHDRHGPEFRTCVCPKSIEDDVREMMVAAGIDDPILLHYGDIKSRNDFEGETVGLVLGCIDPGDHNVMSMLGLLGLDAEPERYSSGGRAHQRGFVGPDADAATELLESVRASNVTQAVGRYARDVRNSDDHARVYVWTDVLPVAWIDEVVPGVSGHVTDLTREIEQVVKDSEEPITAKEVAGEVDCSKKHAWETLGRMCDQGVLAISHGTGRFGADEYQYREGSLAPTVRLDPIE